MTSPTVSASTTVSPTDRLRQLAPALVLVVLSPILVELLMGAVTVSRLWLLLPEMGVYGIGALLIREAVRRTGRSWGTMLALGVAFAIFEECLLLQTSFTPQFFPPARDQSFGWAYGVQWFYFIAMLGYESVYAIVLPIYLTEMIFPERREELWLTRRGMRIAGVIFAACSVVVWWLWHFVGLQRYGPSTYEIPTLNLALAVIAIAVIMLVALYLPFPARAPQPTTRRARSPWLVGALAFIFGLGWFFIIVFAFLPAAPIQNVSPLIPVGYAVLWGGLALFTVQRLSTAHGWGDRQRIALIFGALLASMLGGTLTVITAAPIDKIGKLVLDLAAIVLLIWFARRVAARAHAQPNA